MPATITIDVQDSATTAVVALENALGTSVYAKAVARVAAAEYTRNFERLAASRHRGGPHNYYLTAARSTMGRAEGGDAVVTIYAPAGIGLRRYGGTVKASGRVSTVTGKPIKSIAIPREGGPAEGRTPLDVKTAGIKLRLVILKSINRAALYGPDSGGKPTVYFWLVGSVTFRPDTAVFPAASDLSLKINSTLDRYAKGVWAKYARNVK
jgi:hypothetical protein